MGVLSLMGVPTGAAAAAASFPPPQAARTSVARSGARKLEAEILIRLPDSHGGVPTLLSSSGGSGLLRVAPVGPGQWIVGSAAGPIAFQSASNFSFSADASERSLPSSSMIRYICSRRSATRLAGVSFVPCGVVMAGSLGSPHHHVCDAPV